MWLKGLPEAQSHKVLKSISIGEGARAGRWTRMHRWIFLNISKWQEESCHCRCEHSMMRGAQWISAPFSKFTRTNTDAAVENEEPPTTISNDRTGKGSQRLFNVDMHEFLKSFMRKEQVKSIIPEDEDHLCHSTQEPGYRRHADVFRVPCFTVEVV